MAMARLLLAAGALLAAFSSGGCRAPEVRRDAEIARFAEQIQNRAAGLNLDPAVPLSMERCVEIALANSLDLRVRKLRESLHDEHVRNALADGLPRIDLNYTDTKRSNKALMGLGGATVEMEDQRMRGATVQGVVPVLDWGTTYYGWRIAKDRRDQERILVERARQTLARDVRTAYVRLASAQRQEQLARVALLAANELRRVAKSLEREGLGSHAATAEVEAGGAEAALAWSGTRRAVEQTHLELAQLLSLPPGTVFAVEDRPRPTRPLVPATDVPGLEESALRNRPELQVQDLQNHIAATSVRQRVAEFFPRVDGLASYNWSSLSFATNPSYWRFGVQVSDTLLNGGRKLWDLRLARKEVTIEQEQTLLLSLGILYEVDFRVLQLYGLYDTVVARQALVTAQTEALRLIVSRYVEGLESGTDTVRSLADMYVARIRLDQATTDFQVAWFELDTAAMLPGPDQPPVAPTPAATAAVPSYEPAPALDSYRQLMDAAPPVDLRQYPELEELLKKAGALGGATP